MIHITAVAVADLDRVRNFLAAQNPQAAANALAIIEAAIDQLEKFPQLGNPTDDPEVRHLHVRYGKGGYVVRYVPKEENNLIVITRIWHSRELRD